MAYELLFGIVNLQPNLMRKEDLPIDRDTLSGYLALVLGFLTGIASILSWVAAPFIWFVLTCFFSLLICRVADKWRYLSGVLFSTAVVMGGLAVLAIARPRYDLKSLYIFVLAWIGSLAIYLLIELLQRRAGK
ncbi:MAG: hypothetical protein RMM17_05230 [Acidobacteriota bacterium]|nr:hypothetical protein [Blastocatellia bacterium]MDW8412067.1 hypothetical protein [Acidobacteriota bacterium]